MSIIFCFTLYFFGFPYSFAFLKITLKIFYKSKKNYCSSSIEKEKPKISQ